MAWRGATCFAKRQTTSTLLSASKFRPFPSLPLPTPASLPRCSRSVYRLQTGAVQEATAVPMSPKKADNNALQEPPSNWKIKMLYDGDCPLCMREVNMLRERNKRFGTIKFVDISSDDYSTEANQGLDYGTVMGRIHAILRDGTVVTDVEAFRRLYEQVGLGWVYAITKYEPVATIADAIYGIWARYRLQVTGRPPLEEIMEARRKSKDNLCKDSGKCRV